MALRYSTWALVPELMRPPGPSDSQPRRSFLSWLTSTKNRPTEREEEENPARQPRGRHRRLVSRDAVACCKGCWGEGACGPALSAAWTPPRPTAPHAMPAALPVSWPAPRLLTSLRLWEFPSHPLRGSVVAACVQLSRLLPAGLQPPVPVLPGSLWPGLLPQPGLLHARPLPGDGP